MNLLEILLAVGLLGLAVGYVVYHITKTCTDKDDPCGRCSMAGSCKKRKTEYGRGRII